MEGNGSAWERRNVWIAGVVGVALVALLVALATDAVGGSDSSPSGPDSNVATGVAGSTDSAATGSGNDGSDLVANASQGSTWVPTADRVAAGEALPCTGPKAPTNFEIFSAGPSVAGLPLNGMVRRCDPGSEADEEPSNYVAYVYGKCKIAEGATGCAPPLQVHSWPACQRSYADYSYDGKPLPYKELPAPDGAKAVEIDFFADNRIEVYTGSSTIVIFASDPAVGRKALEQLRSQEPGEPPETRADALGETGSTQLEPPSDGAMEGNQSCQS